MVPISLLRVNILALIVSKAAREQRGSAQAESDKSRFYPQVIKATKGNK
jgi:hypothetical protein